MAKEMKSLNGYEIVDKTARDIANDSKDRLYQMANDGQNLYIGSSKFTGPWKNLSTYNLYNSGLYPGLIYAEKNSLWEGLYQEIYVNAGETYTLSAWVQSSKQLAINTYFTYNNSSSCNANGDGVQYFQITQELKRISATATITKSGVMYARFEVYDNPDKGKFYILGIKLERGNTPTEYIPDNLPLYGSTAPTSNTGFDGDFYVMI